MGGQHFKNWLEIEMKSLLRPDLLRDPSLHYLCGIRIAGPHAVNPKWRFFCKSSGKAPAFLGSAP